MRKSVLYGAFFLWEKLWEDLTLHVRLAKTELNHATPSVSSLRRTPCLKESTTGSYSITGLTSSEPRALSGFRITRQLRASNSEQGKIISAFLFACTENPTKTHTPSISNAASRFQAYHHIHPKSLFLHVRFVSLCTDLPQRHKFYGGYTLPR